MNVALVNLSKHVSCAEMNLMAAALQHQQIHDYGPGWSAYPLRINYAGAGKAVADQAMARPGAVVLVIDDPDQADALGYHYEDRDRVLGKVFVKPVLDNGGTVLGDPSDPGSPSVATTLSHEVLELAGDPYCNDYSDDLDGNRSVAKELGDPVEADAYPVVVPGGTVMMSNFVLPAWFDPQSARGPWDHMGKLSAPFTMTPGGYLIVRTGGPGTETQVFGDVKPPAWKLEAKSHPLARTSRRGVRQAA